MGFRYKGDKRIYVGGRIIPELQLYKLNPRSLDVAIKKGIITKIKDSKNGSEKNIAK